MEIERPYLIFLGDAKDALAAKTAFGVVDWRRDWCVGQLRLPGCKADVGLPDMKVAEAAAAGARTLLIGVVNPGGIFPPIWTKTLIDTLDAKLDIASGMHEALASIDGLAAAAERNGRRLFDVRLSKQVFTTGSGRKRRGKRLLTVGTDCAVGKKYTALALEKDMRSRGLDAEFRATGQTGILIAGRGVAIDAVVADFIAGAAEWLTPDNDPAHWDIVEGQGSLYHPSFAGVSLGLLHGSQPDAIVMCHEPTRTTLRNVDNPVPDISDCIDLNLRLGRMTNPAIRCVGVAVNTAALSAADAERVLLALAKKTGLPATDPVRYGVRRLVDHLLSLE